MILRGRTSVVRLLLQPRAVRRAAVGVVVGTALLACLAGRAAEQVEPLRIEPRSRVVIVGNTMAERMQYVGHWETLLHHRFPRHELVVRNLGWSADEVNLRPRSQNFSAHGHTLADHRHAAPRCREEIDEPHTTGGGDLAHGGGVPLQIGVGAGAIGQEPAVQVLVGDR